MYCTHNNNFFFMPKVVHARAMGRAGSAADAASASTATVIVATEEPSEVPGARREVRQYTVGGRDAGTFTKGIFNTNAVCSLIEEATGQRAAPGCQDAAAFTQWQIGGTGGTGGGIGGTGGGIGAWTAYDAAGAKQPFTATVDIKYTVPTHRDATTAADARDIARFLSRLAVHELGHCATGERVLAAMQEFVRRLPDTVPADEVGDTNALVKLTLAAYETAGRQADVAYDLYTGHGLTQGAVAPEDDNDGASTSSSGASASSDTPISITSTAGLF
jgi:hypothetical protein